MLEYDAHPKRQSLSRKSYQEAPIFLGYKVPFSLVPATRLSRSKILAKFPVDSEILVLWSCLVYDVSHSMLAN